MEIFIIWKIAKTNANLAVARGRSPGIAIAYTVILWFWFEILGFFIGAAVCKWLGWPMRLIFLFLLAAFPMALLGGFLSRQIAKRGEAFYTPPQS